MIEHPVITQTERFGDFPKPAPICECCGDPIHDDYVWDTPDGTLCEDCAKQMYRKNIENYLEE